MVPFQEVWGRSYCRALERLADIACVYPSEVEHMFSPSCVSLLRCTGCCGDENLHCVPVETVNVTMQVARLSSLGPDVHTLLRRPPNLPQEGAWGGKEGGPGSQVHALNHSAPPS